MFSLLISVISICLVIMMTVLSITANGGGVDLGSVVVFFMGIAGFGLFLWGFFWGVKKVLGGIPSFWGLEEQSNDISRKKY